MIALGKNLMHSICSKNPGFCDLINCLCIYNLAWFRTTLFSWWSFVANCLQDVCSDSYELNIRLASNSLLVCYQWLLLESKPPFLFTVNKMNELDAVLKLWVKVSKLSLKIPCWWFISLKKSSLHLSVPLEIIEFLKHA
jgi:hypothetical protein